MTPGLATRCAKDARPIFQGMIRKRTGIHTMEREGACRGSAASVLLRRVLLRRVLLRRRFRTETRTGDADGPAGQRSHYRATAMDAPAIWMPPRYGCPRDDVSI